MNEMKPAATTSYNITYKWLSCCLVLAVACYWLMTFGLVFFGSKVSSAIPKPTLLYRTFARQNWRLFAITKLYNRQMNFIVRDKQNPAKADTTDLVQYLLTEKRAYAPFNNYEDALDRILYIEMNVSVCRKHLKFYYIDNSSYPDLSPVKSAAYFTALKGSTHHFAQFHLADDGRQGFSPIPLDDPWVCKNQLSETFVKV